jgi:hypothetical protein
MNSVILASNERTRSPLLVSLPFFQASLAMEENRSKSGNIGKLTGIKKSPKKFANIDAESAEAV